MLEICENDIRSAVEAVGIGEGDSLMVYSAIHVLGVPNGNLEIYLRALVDAVGDKGTLAFPAFSDVYPRTRRFDPKVDHPERVGVLAERARLWPGVRRTLHPVSSLTVLGRHADDLVSRDTPSAFDPGSQYECMLEHDFKILFLGLPHPAASIVHYCEQRAGVPYRWWMDFPGEVKVGSRWRPSLYRVYVRRRDVDARLEFGRVGRWLEERRWLESCALNYGRVSTCRMQHYADVVDEKLAADPWALVENRDEATRRLDEAGGPRENAHP